MKHENARPPKAVILAAGIGSRPIPLTDDTPQSLLSVGGSAVLERMIRNCLSCGISQFVLVLGHGADQIRQFVDKAFRGIRVTYVINDRYRDTGSAYSLMLASSAIGTADFIKFDANMVFETTVLRRLLDRDLPNLLCINRDIALENAVVTVVTDEEMRVLECGKSIAPNTAAGESIGIEKIGAKVGPLLFTELAEMMESTAHQQDCCESAYARLMAKGMVFHALDVTGLTWSEIDTADGFAAANAMFASPITTVSRGQERVLAEVAAKEITLT